MKKNYTSLIYIVLLFFTSCGAYFNQPFDTTKARIGEDTSGKSILDGILPQQETVVHLSTNH